MTYERDLCLALMDAATEDDVYDVLKDAGLWDNADAWRYFGDVDNNFSTIGNQQSKPEAALVEKLVNSVDARLINECLVRDIDPEGPSAPRSIREAVARFFEEGSNSDAADAGRVKYWPNEQRKIEGRLITLSATGKTPPGDPTLSVADVGEGQTPRDVPFTFMSLQRSNKLRIPFVQGKFNMGGTGALRFCGERKLQLVVTRRNPRLLNPGGPASDGDWAFSVVRREDPSDGRRSSMFTYLAPLGADARARAGDVLHFSADSLRILPEGRDAHARDVEYGSLIKLYEYELPGIRSNIIQSDPSLLRRLDFLMPEVALPIRLYECRKYYRGHAGSFENNVNGITVRLSDDRSENLEPEFPSSGKIGVRGEQMETTIYAFKRKKAELYRRQEGVAFIVNGQTHGHLTVDFFRRQSVGMGYLADSLLITVDCSDISARMREDLFMNSRDRLQDGELKQEVEKELQDLLKSHAGLSALRARRREEEIAARLEDSKPLTEVLENLLKRSPSLSNLFLKGLKLPTPFKTKKVGEAKKFKGKKFPTFFKFKGLDYGKTLDRNCHLGNRVRLVFETDAVNDYFDRDTDEGQLDLTLEHGQVTQRVANFSLNLHEGIATLTFDLPAASVEGETVAGVATVSDETQMEPFENRVVLHVKGPAKKGGGNGTRRKPPSKDEGDEREDKTTLALPEIIPVHEEDWEKHGFDKHSALKIVHAGTVGNAQGYGTGSDIYDFYVNVDNLYLKTEQKASNAPAELLQAKFTYGLVLVGLALLQEDSDRRKAGRVIAESNGHMDITQLVSVVSQSVAPVLLPMVDSLGALSEGV